MSSMHCDGGGGGDERGVGGRDQRSGVEDFPAEAWRKEGIGAD